MVRLWLGLKLGHAGHRLAGALSQRNFQPKAFPSRRGRVDDVFARVRGNGHAPERLADGNAVLADLKPRSRRSHLYLEPSKLRLERCRSLARGLLPIRLSRSSCLT